MKQILVIILACALFLGVFAISPNYITPKSMNDLEYYVLADGTVKIFNYKGKENKVTVPETIEGRTVSSIEAKSIGYTDGAKKTEDFLINGYYGSAAYKYAESEDILFNCLHKFNTEILKEASYSNKGSKKLTCACGFTKTEEIDYVKIPDISLSSAVADGDGIVLKWNKIDGLNTYNIYRSVDGGEYQKIEAEGSTYTDYEADSGLIKYYITGCGGKNEGKKEISPVTVDYLKSPVTYLSSESNGIKIDWNSSTGAVSYRVYKKDSDGNYQKIYEADKSSARTFTDTDVKKQSEYFYSVVAVDKNGTESAKFSDGKKLVFGEQAKVVYLTFDDGPSENTLKILKTLKKYNAKATFFVIGNSKTEYMKNIVEEGHQIALHTYSHDYGKIYSGTSAYFNDLQKIRDLVYKKTGVDTEIMRFPGGASNTISANYSKGIMTKLTKQVEKKGYKYFDWNVNSGDADGTNVPADKIVNNVKRDSKGVSRCVVLMHDTLAKKTTVKALDKICKYYKDNGYEFDVLSKHSLDCHQTVNN